MRILLVSSLDRQHVPQYITLTVPCVLAKLRLLIIGNSVLIVKFYTYVSKKFRTRLREMHTCLEILFVSPLITIMILQPIPRANCKIVFHFLEITWHLLTGVN